MRTHIVEIAHSSIPYRTVQQVVVVVVVVVLHGGVPSGAPLGLSAMSG